MRILGIDTSLSCTGWAVVEDGIVKESGTIKTKSKDDFDTRLWQIRKAMYNSMGIFSDESLDYVAMESIFVYDKRSFQTPLKIAQVHGIIKSAIFEWFMPSLVKTYSPAEVKKAVTGSGRAKKEQVLKMVKLQSGYKGKQLDESDAIAVALTCERAMHNNKNQFVK